MISVIVPVYNIEMYIEKCVKSIINQTYKDIEVILVDDGSTDDSGKICDKLAAMDNRIFVIHKENGGLSDARNVGIDVSKGEYIGFVDGDDYISPYMYQHLLEILQLNHADMAMCDFCEINESQEKQTKDEKKEVEICVEILNGIQVYDLVTEFKASNIVAWNKLYKKEIFANIRYHKGRLHEDQWLIPYVAYNCHKVAKSSAKLYYYVFRKNAISKVDMKPSRMWDLLDAMANTCSFFKEKRLYDEQKKESRHLCNHIMYYYQNADRYFENSHEMKKQLHMFYRNTMNLNRNVFGIKNVMYNAFSISPVLGLKIKGLRDRV